MKNILIGAISLFLVFTMVTIAKSGSVLTPTVLEGGKIISAEEMKSIVDQQSAAIFDVRNPINYGKGHISNVTSLPYSGEVIKVIGYDPPKDIIDMSKLPSDKNTTVIFHSHGDTGWKSYIAAVLAINSGYQNVMWFRGGFGEWESRGYSVRLGR